MNSGLVRSAAQLSEEAETWMQADLIALWGRIQARQRIHGWMSGRAFEHLVIRAFQVEGADVRWPFQVTCPERFGTMEQNDGFVYLRDRAFLIESKAAEGGTGIEAVAKLRFRLEVRPPGTMGLLFSSTAFTQPTDVFGSRRR